MYHQEFIKGGLERQLSDKEHLLFLQKYLGSVPRTHMVAHSHH